MRSECCRGAALLCTACPLSLLTMREFQLLPKPSAAFKLRLWLPLGVIGAALSAAAGAAAADASLLGINGRWIWSEAKRSANP